MRSLDQFKSSLGSSASSGAAKSFQISSRQPSYSNSSGSFANLKLVAEKLVKEQASSKTDLEVPGDSPKWVRHCTNEDYVAMASQNGLVILSSCEIIRALGRNTRGAVAMRLKEGDRMACVDIIPAAKQDGIESVPGAHHGHKPHGPWLLFVSKNGFGKRVPLSRFRQSPLNRVGLIGYKFSSEDCLAAVFVVGFTTADDGESDKQVVLVSQSGTVNRIKVRDIPIQSRYARLKSLNVGWSEKQRYIKQKLDMIVPLYFGYVLFVIVI